MAAAVRNPSADWVSVRILDEAGEQFTLSTPVGARVPIKQFTMARIKKLIEVAPANPDSPQTLTGTLDGIRAHLMDPCSGFGIRQLLIYRLKEPDKPTIRVPHDNTVEQIRRLRWHLGRNIAYVFVVKKDERVAEGYVSKHAEASEGYRLLGYFDGLEHEPTWKYLDEFCKWRTEDYRPAGKAVPRLYLSLAIGIDLEIGHTRATVGNPRPSFPTNHFTLVDALQLPEDTIFKHNGEDMTAPWSLRRWSSPDYSVALVTDQPDEPHELATTASVLGGHGVNICGCFVRRNADKEATLIFLTDKQIPPDAIETFQSLRVKPQLWSWENPEDLDLSDRPTSIHVDTIVIRFYSDDRPGRIARIARRLGENGVNISTFLIGRSLNRLRLDKDEASRARFKPATEVDEGSTILCFCDAWQEIDGDKVKTWWEDANWKNLLKGLTADLVVDPRFHPRTSGVEPIQRLQKVKHNNRGPSNLWKVLPNHDGTPRPS